MLTPEECSSLLATSSVLSALSAGHLGNPEGRSAQAAACALVANICAGARDRAHARRSMEAAKNNSGEGA